MLSLVYSEILKMLRLWGLLDFDIEIFFPHNPNSLPRGYRKQKSKESDQPHIMTSESLLTEVISALLPVYILYASSKSFLIVNLSQMQASYSIFLLVVMLYLVCRS